MVEIIRGRCQCIVSKSVDTLLRLNYRVGSLRFKNQIFANQKRQDRYLMLYLLGFVSLILIFNFEIFLLVIYTIFPETVQIGVNPESD